MELRSYLDYVALFNSQDWEGVHERYFTKDFRAALPIATLTSRAEALAWFKRAHETYVEVIVPEMVDIDVAVRRLRANIRLHFFLFAPSEITPNGAAGKAGDTIEVPARVEYELAGDGRFSSLAVEFTGPPRTSNLLPVLLPEQRPAGADEREPLPFG